MLVDFEPPECRLVFEGRTSRARAGVAIEPSPQVLAMDLAGVATRGSRTGGVAVVRCQGDDHAAVSNVRLTAVRTGQLTLMDLAQDLQTTHGSGAPEVTHISGTQDGTVAAPKVGAWTDVSTLQVPAGPYLVKATLRVDGTAPGGLAAPRRMICRLTDGSDTDSDVITKIDYASRRSLAIVKSGPVRVVRLQCRMPEGGSGEVTALNLTAFEVGSWSTDPL
jgi:hypothetical protein